MATQEQVRQVEAVRAQRYEDWHASVQHDARLEELAQLQELEGLKELARLQDKLAQPMSRRAIAFGNATEDMGGVIVSAISFGTLADQFTEYASIPEKEQRVSVLPVETRRTFGATALSQELRMNPSAPNLTATEVYTGYAAA